MKSSPRWLCLAVLLASSAAMAWADAPAALQAAQEKEKSALAAVQTAREAKLAALLKWYGDSLEVVRKHALSTGDLDLVVATKMESERMGAALSPEEVAKLPSALQGVRQQFDKANAAIAAWEQASNQTVTRALLVELETLEKQFTRAAQIDEAVQVRVERAAVAGRLAGHGQAGAANPTPAEAAPAPEPAPDAATAAPATRLKAVIPANSPDAYPIRDLHKGNRISLQYAGGKWKSWGKYPTSTPEEAAGPSYGDACRVVISLPSQNGHAGKVLAVVPGGTQGHPFSYQLDADYPELVLRINDKDDTYAGNPGQVEYDLEILSPAK